MTIVPFELQSHSFVVVVFFLQCWWWSNVLALWSQCCRETVIIVVIFFYCLPHTPFLGGWFSLWPDGHLDVGHTIYDEPIKEAIFISLDILECYVPSVDCRWDVFVIGAVTLAAEVHMKGVWCCRNQILCQCIYEWI